MKCLLSVLICFFVTQAFANDLKTDCYDLKRENSQREAACKKYLENVNLVQKEKVKSFYMLGYVQNQQEKYEEAISNFSRAVALDPFYEKAYKRRAYAFGRLKEYQNAIADLKSAIKLNPGSAWTYFYLGYIYHQLDNRADACKSYEQSLFLNPKYKTAYFYRAQLYKKDNDYLKAIKDYSSYINLSPFEYGIYLSRGELFKHQGENFKAYQDFTTARLLYPGSQHIQKLIQSVETKEDNIQLSPMNYEAPKDGLEIKYLHVVKNKTLTGGGDDILGDLFSWFETEPEPIRGFSNITQRRIIGTRNQLTNIGITQLFPKQFKASSMAFQSVLPIEISFQRGPKIRVVHNLEENISP